MGGMWEVLNPRVLLAALLLALSAQSAVGQCSSGQYLVNLVCTTCAAGQSSPNLRNCFYCHDNSGVWPAGQGGRGFVRTPGAANCTSAEWVCLPEQYISATGVCSNCTGNRASPDWASCTGCSDDSGAWPTGRGGLGFVKVAGVVACQPATSACAKGRYANSAAACVSCGAGQSSPDGIVCRSCSDASSVWPTGQGGVGYVKSTVNQTCVRAAAQCLPGQVASAGACLSCAAGMSGLNFSRCVYCNEPGVWPSGTGGPGWVKSATNQTCVRAAPTCGGGKYSINGHCGTCPTGMTTDGAKCFGPTCATNCSSLSTECRTYACSTASLSCIITANLTGNPCNSTQGTCSNGVCVRNTTPACSLNCTLLNTECRNYTCSAVSQTCVVAANRTGSACNGTAGICSAAGLCTPKNTTTPGVVPPDASVWPDPAAPTILRIKKTAGFELTDADGNSLEPQWMHLHFDGDPAARTVTLTVEPVDASGWPTGVTPSGIQVRYTVQGVPVSPWLSPASWTYTLAQDSPWLANVKDGVLDITLQVMGATRLQYRPWPAFLHLKRGQELSPLVPVMVGDNPTSMGPRIPVITRVARTERKTGWQGYPANPNLTRWSSLPYSSNLYVEQLTPGGALFEEMQMWWEDLPSHPNLTFIRGLQPYQGEDPRGVNHSRLPVQDGPRGVGWVSSYISGKVDNHGRLVFAELAGRVGWLKPNGEILTIAGWVTKPGSEPVWIRKTLSAVRGRQQLRGRGTVFESLQGFGRPIDTAFDPAAPSVIYVSDHAYHCIWKLTILTGTGTYGEPNVQVAMLAGSSIAESGYQDGPGSSARFNEPFGISWARERGTNASVLYVADSANHAVRRIDLATGVVSTLWGGPSMATGRDGLDRATLRTSYPGAVTAAQAAAGTRPGIYWPFALRVDSQGNVILLEHGLAQIRRLDPAANTSVVIAPVDNLKFSEYDHGWAWLDVDTTGATGPVDGIWWCMAVGDSITGDPGYHFNEVFAWVPNQAGAQSHFVFTGRGGGANPEGFGARDGTTPPHYPWLVAVDPRGGLLMSGMGVHGISRLRLAESPDKDPTATESYPYYLGDGLFDGWGVGPNAASLAFRAGNSAHGMLGLGVDGWATWGIRNNDSALLEFYGATDITGDDRVNLLEFLRKQTGPARDALPTAPLDTALPSTPASLSMSISAQYPGSIVLTWSLSTDDKIVAGYAVQVVRTLPDDTTTGAGLFTPANLALPLNTDLARFNGAWLGNTNVALLEALAGGYRYHARLIARDMAGKWSGWSVPTSFLLA